MTQDEMYEHINALSGSRDGALLAAFWLMLGSRYEIQFCTLGDLQRLSGNSLFLFEGIRDGYRKKSFSKLSPILATNLMNIVVRYECRIN